MAPNGDGISGALHMLSAYPMDDEDVQFYFLDTTSGFEEAWAQIVSIFMGSLTLPTDLKTRVQALEKEREPAAQVLKDCLARTQAPKFHVLGKSGNRRPKFPVTIKQCIDFNVLDMAGTLMPIPLSGISEEDQRLLKLIEETSNGHGIYSFRDRLWILPSGGSELLPKEVKLVFSRHSSFSESRELVRMFRPHQVFPCCESKESWLSGFSMERVFGDLCISKKFAYDVTMFKRFGRPSVQIQERPILTINRWSFGECENEHKFVQNVLQGKETQFNFKGIGGFGKKGTLEHREFSADRAKDSTLEDLISGRKEKIFKYKIAQYQQAYSDRALREVQGLLREYDCAENIPDQGSSFSDSLRSSKMLDSSPTSSLKHEPPSEGKESMEEVSGQQTDFPAMVSRSPKVSRPRLVRRSSTSKVKDPSVSTTAHFAWSFEQKVVSKRSILLQSSSVMNSKKIKTITEALRDDPNSWFSLRLSSVSPSTEVVNGWSMS